MHPPTVKTTLQYSVALIAFVGLLGAIWMVGRDGLSARFAEDALDRNLLVSADRAIALNNLSPEAFYARASLYRKSGRIADAIRDLERAVSLKSGDYFLRLELGYARYQSGDIKGATLDFEAATRLAPFYAQPRWYLGNMLLEAGQLDEGFAELRRAVTSDPSYLPQAIQLATAAFDGDPVSIVKAVKTESWGSRLVLARHLIQHGHLSPAMELFRTGKDIPTADLRSLQSELQAAKQFAEAHEVWLIEKGIDRSQANEGSISDGGFEREIAADSIGFTWQIDPRLEKIRISRDFNEFHSGTSSLRVVYDGNSQPSVKVASHLVLVESDKNYRLSFAAQTKKMVTGGLPVVMITDATSGRVLGQSSALPEGSSGWKEYLVELKTGPETKAVLLSMQRSGCSSSPCPAFGEVWFDDFKLQKQ